SSCNDDEMIARSPSSPESEDEEWLVHGIVGEDVDIFGISKYIRWKDWSGWHQHNMDA
ncbi:hypothetical protein BGW80DRAFT_1370462, partial [Lactifluus volemus]